MPSDAKPTPIRSLIEDGELVINDGYRAKNRELASDGLPFARAQNINDGFRFDGADCFPEADLAKVGIKISQPGDVVFTSKGTVGRFAMVRPDTPRFVYAPQLCFWRSLNQEKIDPRWLYYWMNSREFFNQFKSVSGQTDMAEYVSLRDQRAMNITLPDVETQRGIASILGSLDNKIELNRRMNRTLERMAQAMFKSWFIDFDPVRAKAAGDPTAAGLPDQLAALFPDRLVDSELGEIPEGWEVKSLDEAFDVNPKRKLTKGTLAPFLEMSNMPTTGPSPAAWRLREMTSGTKFIKGDTLVARITPCLENGKTAFVDFLYPGQVGWGSTEYIVLRPKGDIPPVFAYLLARTELFRTFAIRQMTGSSGRQRVPPDSLSALQLALPAIDSPLHKAFGDQVNPYFERISLSARQNRKLAGVRDTLLPKLLSGELEVPEAEAAIEEIG